MTYLDYNATTPLGPEARASMLAWLGVAANPSSTHALGRAANRAVEDARVDLGELLQSPARAIVFTGGATESNAAVLSRGRWAGSAVEHPSVRAWCAAAIPVDREGVVDLDAIDRLDGVDGVAVMLANNETGVIQPIAEVVARARRRGLRVHVDATQAPGKIPLDACAGADSVALSAHKFGGPQGVGVLRVGSGDPSPLLRGGSQERGWRPGTHNVAGICGAAAAARAARASLADGTPERTAALRDRLEAACVALGARVAGAGAPRLPNTSAVVFPGVAAADLVMALDLEGVCASAGAACASGAHKPSPVLEAMGLAGSAVRFSLGPGTTPEDVARAAEALRLCLERSAR